MTAKLYQTERHLGPSDTADNTEFQKEPKIHANFMAPKKAQQLVDPWVDSAMPSLSQRTAKVANRKQQSLQKSWDRRELRRIAAKRDMQQGKQHKNKRRSAVRRPRLARSPVAPMSTQKAGHTS